jgi:putative transposase
VAVLKQVDMGMPVSDVTRQLGTSEQTFYHWKKAYGGLQPDQAREWRD